MSIEKSSLIGTCEKMCPESEVRFRLKNNIIHQLETDNPWELKPTKRRKPILERIVKEYSRPAADKKIHPESLRSYSALKKTIIYLLAFKSEFNNPTRWSIVYYFIKDRLRAVRQDLIVQNLPADQCIDLLESMIPFYLEAAHRCELKQTPNYDKKLHSTELEECFTRWKTAVDSLSGDRRFSKNIMLSYFFYHIDDMYFRQEFFKWEDFLFGLNSVFNDIYSSIHIGNYIRFFRLLIALNDPLWKNALFCHIGKYRCSAFKIFSTAFRGPFITLPTKDLSYWLSFPDDESLWSCLNSMFELVSIYSDTT